MIRNLYDISISNGVILINNKPLWEGDTVPSWGKRQIPKDILIKILNESKELEVVSDSEFNNQAQEKFLNKCIKLGKPDPDEVFKYTGNKLVESRDNTDYYIMKYECYPYESEKIIQVTIWSNKCRKNFQIPCSEIENFLSIIEK